MNPKLPISVCIITLNEEARLRACLEAVQFCEEIIVVDSLSTDRTQDIAREMGARVVEQEFLGYIGQKEFACSLATHDWILSIDADEVVTPELQASIRTLFNQDGYTGDPSVSGYEMNRVVFFLDRWWRNGGWYPEYRLRLFRNSKAHLAGTEPHDKVVVEGRVGRLSGELSHFTYDDLSSQFAQLLRFARLSGRAAYDKGRRFKLSFLLVNPVLRFIKFYFLKRGYREGIAGLIVAIAESYYTFMKYAYLWEQEFNHRKQTK